VKSHHLLTVGISLLTNFARERSLPVDEAAKHHKAIAEFLHADPRKACAASRTSTSNSTAPAATRLSVPFSTNWAARCACRCIISTRRSRWQWNCRDFD